MTKKAVVLLVEGFEEVEAVTPVDYLRRAGIEVTTAAVSVGNALAVKGARGIAINADTTLEELSVKNESAFWDAVIIPGGMPGAVNIASSKEACALIAEAAAAGKWVCAICASPAIVLAPLGLLAGRKFTCYPGFEEKVSGNGAANGGEWTGESVVVDGNAGSGGIITSRSAGTAGVFAITVIRQLLGNAEADKIAKAVII